MKRFELELLQLRVVAFVSFIGFLVLVGGVFTLGSLAHENYFSSTHLKLLLGVLLVVCGQSAYFVIKKYGVARKVIHLFTDRFVLTSYAPKENSSAKEIYFSEITSYHYLENGNAQRIEIKLKDESKLKFVWSDTFSKESGFELFYEALEQAFKLYNEKGEVGSAVTQKNTVQPAVMIDYPLKGHLPVQKGGDHAPVKDEAEVEPTPEENHFIKKETSFFEKKAAKWLLYIMALAAVLFTLHLIKDGIDRNKLSSVFLLYSSFFTYTSLYFLNQNKKHRD